MIIVQPAEAGGFTKIALKRTKSMEESEYDRVRKAVVSFLIKRQAEGVNLQKGYFGGYSGGVTLSVSTHSESEYAVCYCVYSRMWNFIISKVELKLSTEVEGFSPAPQN